MDARSHWERVHEENAADEVSWHVRDPTTSLRLLRFVGAGPDTRIVDVGCGQRGLAAALPDPAVGRLTSVDVAEAALERARKLATVGSEDRTEWVRADVLEFASAQEFDVWHDRAVLHFLVREKDRARYVDVVRRALRVEGHVILATFAPDGPEQCSGLPVRRSDAADLGALFGSGFRLVHEAREEHVTPWGTRQAFQWVVLERKKEG